MKKTEKTFAQQLDEALKAKKLRQIDLADFLGVQRQQIYRWLNSGVVPKDEMMNRIAEYLEVTFEVPTKEFSKVPKELRHSKVMELPEDERNAMFKVYSARESYLRALDVLFYGNISAETIELLVPELQSSSLRLGSMSDDFEKQLKKQK